MIIDWDDLHPSLSLYDWQAAFGIDYSSSCPETSFKMEEVAEVLYVAAERGDYAETNLWAIFKLTDGSFAYLDAGCDTTGWDCQAGNYFFVRVDFDELVREIGDDARSRFELKSQLQY